MTGRLSTWLACWLHWPPVAGRDRPHGPRTQLASLINAHGRTLSFCLSFFGRQPRLPSRPAARPPSASASSCPPRILIQICRLWPPYAAISQPDRQLPPPLPPPGCKSTAAKLPLPPPTPRRPPHLLGGTASGTLPAPRPGVHVYVQDHLVGPLQDTCSVAASSRPCKFLPSPSVCPTKLVLNRLDCSTY